MLAALLTSPGVWVLFIIAGLFAFDVSDLRNRKTQENIELNFMEDAEVARPALCAYFIAAGALAFITSSRVGANVNYYLEPDVVISIITSIVWARLSHGRRFYSLPLLLSRCLRCQGCFKWLAAPEGNTLDGRACLIILSTRAV